MGQNYKGRLVQCRELTGRNGNAAELLYRIAYWLPKAWEKSDGQKWIANERSWWVQQTGFTFDQIKRSLALLLKLTLIETRQALHNNRNKLHVRLTDRAACVLMPDQSYPAGGAPHQPGHIASLGQGTPTPPEMCRTAPLYNVQGDTSGKVQQKEQCVLAHAILDSEKIKEESITGKDKGNHPTRIALKKMVKPSPKAAAHSAGTVCALEAKWRATVEGIFSGYVVCLNPQQRGQLKNFLNACLEGRSEVVLEYAVRNWCTFTQRAKSDAAAFNLPTKPDIGFLLKYTGIAVNLWLDAQKAAPLSHPGTCLAPNPTAIQPAAKKSFITEAKATKAEVFAKLGMYPPE